MVRKRRKASKQRGTRTMGRGSAKRGRKSGERGGTGVSGGHKHRWSYVTKHEPEKFGKHGFVRPPGVSRVVNAVNVGELDERVDELVQRGEAKREQDKIIIDAAKLGFDKILGGGCVTHALEIVAKEFTEQAKRKLEEAGGKAIPGEG